MPSATRVMWAKFRATAVTVAALAILGVFIYLLTGGTIFEEKAQLYLYVPDATGIASGTPVRVNDIDVGKVSSVALSGSNNPDRVIRLTLTVQRDYFPDIPVNSYAQISTETAIGDKYVDITRGTSPVQISANATVLYKPQPQLLKTLDLQQFEQQLRMVDALLSDIEQGRNRVGQFLLGDTVYNDLRASLSQAERGLREAVSTTSDLGGILYTDELYRRFRSPLAQLDETLRHLQAGQGQLGRLLREDAQYQQLRDQAAALDRSLGELRSQKFLASDEDFVRWNRMLVPLIERVDEWNAGPEFSSSATYDNLAGFARQLGASLREFRENPQKFMRFKLF